MSWRTVRQTVGGVRSIESWYKSSDVITKPRACAITIKRMPNGKDLPDIFPDQSPKRPITPTVGESSKKVKTTKKVRKVQL